MNGFSLHLQHARGYQRVDRVRAFVGRDASGNFGLLPGHERFMTSLVFGLARFRTGEGNWEYLALPGGLVHFVDNELILCTRQIFRDPDYQRVSTLLRTRLAAEEQELQAVHKSLRRLEQEMFRRLRRLGRFPETPP